MLAHGTATGPLVLAHVHRLAADIFAEAAVTAWTAHHRDPLDAAYATDLLVWAEAMHEAAWAAELAGGLWNAVSSQLAATVVHDLLPSAVADVVNAFGPSPPR